MNVGLIFEIWFVGAVVLLILAPCYNLFPDVVIEKLKTRREKHEDEEWRQRGLEPMRQPFPDHILARVLMLWVLVPTGLLVVVLAGRLVFDLIPNIRHIMQTIFAVI